MPFLNEIRKKMQTSHLRQITPRDLMILAPPSFEIQSKLAVTKTGNFFLVMVPKSLQLAPLFLLALSQARRFNEFWGGSWWCDSVLLSYVHFYEFFFSVRVVTESGDVYRQTFASCRTRAKALSHMRGFDGC